MFNALVRTCLVALCSSLAISTVSAQEMIHAITGTVTAVQPKVGMIEISTDDGSSGHFKCLEKNNVSYDFDKSVRENATPADKFTTVGAHVIVYYFGDSDVRTAVALRDLGTTPVMTTRGTVVKLNRKEHQLIIKNGTGGQVTFALDPTTVGDTATGVADSYKFDFAKGDPVQVIAKQSKGNEAALLIAPVM